MAHGGALAEEEHPQAAAARALDLRRVARSSRWRTLRARSAPASSAGRRRCCARCDRGCPGSRRRRWRSTRSAGWPGRRRPPSRWRRRRWCAAASRRRRRERAAAGCAPARVAGSGRHRVADGGRDEVDRAELALARLLERRPGGAAVGGAQQRVPAGRPAVLVIGEVHLVEGGAAAVLPGPGAPGVGGGQDPARAGHPAVTRVGELDRGQGRGAGGEVGGARTTRPPSATSRPGRTSPIAATGRPDRSAAPGLAGDRRACRRGGATRRQARDGKGDHGRVRGPAGDQ